MGRNIALFLDGTWNDPRDDTNVLKASRLLREDGPPIYFSGVGTTGDRLGGGLFGFGLDAKVREAYAAAARAWRAGDRLFLFGFSRGAFTARSLAGMIVKCGLLDPEVLRREPERVDWLWRYYIDGKTLRQQDIRHQRRKHGRVPTADEQWLLDSCAKGAVHFIGVWDTVGALGIPFGGFPGLGRRDFRFHNTRPSRYYDYFYQALAIDERREDYPPTLLSRFAADGPEPNERPYAEQRWFAGAHANVGGGIGKGTLSDLPLAWMLAKARDRGLALADFTPHPEAERGEIDNSYHRMGSGLYALLRASRDRTIGAGPFRVTARDGTPGLVQPVNETIDASVFRRWQADRAYRPQPLVDWARRLGLDPAALTGAVTALDGKPF